MGSMIHLAVGRLEIDWGKNNSFRDHSPLFQAESDLGLIPYYYAGEESGKDFEGDTKWTPIIEMKEGLSKPLREVIERIRLLGHSFQQCKIEFEFLLKVNDVEEGIFTFKDFCQVLAGVDVNQLSLDYGEDGEDFGKFFRREIAPRLGLEEKIKYNSNISYAMENLSAETILTLLAVNPSASNLPVQWAFKDLEENGWANRNQFVKHLDPANRFLVVTEGSSDAAILRHALNILKPHVADFFHFIDMQEGYPFSGTGNVYRFVQGLIGISVLNNTLILFDNDTEGVFNYQRCQNLKMPRNMRVLKLPDINPLKAFPTIGPNGEHTTDINGKGAAIECYLDLGENARVRWTGYNDKMENYQGELENKSSYTKKFLDQPKRDLEYDYSRLEAVLDLLIANASKIREREVQEQWGENLEQREYEVTP